MRDAKYHLAGRYDLRLNGLQSQVRRKNITYLLLQHTTQLPVQVANPARDRQMPSVPCWHGTMLILSSTSDQNDSPNMPGINQDGPGGIKSGTYNRGAQGQACHSQGVCDYAFHLSGQTFLQNLVLQVRQIKLVVRAWHKEICNT